MMMVMIMVTDGVYMMHLFMIRCMMHFDGDEDRVRVTISMIMFMMVYDSRYESNFIDANVIGVLQALFEDK